MSLLPVPPDGEMLSIAEYIYYHWDEVVKHWRISDELKQSYECATTYYQKLAALKKYYLSCEEDILKSHKRCAFGWFVSYPIDWSTIFSPIEQKAWNSIRCKGRVVLYPQYPALNYHLDFANPGYKIALELDGKEFHNKECDEKRDAELKKAGWTIYRVTGKEMNYQTYKDWYDVEYMDDDDKIEYLRDWILNSGDGVIEAIKQIHFEKSNGCFYNEYTDTYGHVQHAYYNAILETLGNHKS